MIIGAITFDYPPRSSIAAADGYHSNWAIVANEQQASRSLGALRMSFASRDDRTLRGRLTEAIDDDIAKRTRFLATGMATSFDDYRYRVGGLQALEFVRGWIDDIVADLNAVSRHD